jgi:2-polyprenyl-3-methyl-5-hydroxy-6-metoxy-1,4-benzoquinol methylase
MVDATWGRFSSTKSVFLVRDKELGKKTFSNNDWMHNNTAHEICEKAKEVSDICIGQGQLVNAFCVASYADKVIAVDREKYKWLILPKSKKFQFTSWNKTKPTPKRLVKKIDFTVCMEVFEHVDVALLPMAIVNVQKTTKSGMMLASTPIKKKNRCITMINFTGTNSLLMMKKYLSISACNLFLPTFAIIDILFLLHLHCQKVAMWI